MKTALCERLGIELPIIQAPMGGVVGPTLASAVSNAGGLGMLSPWRAQIDAVRRQIRETRALTSRPFGVNLNLEFPQEERLAACLGEGDLGRFFRQHRIIARGVVVHALAATRRSGYTNRAREVQAKGSNGVL